ncbi:MAG TPA: GvpL/GvpF family gas vesicle protein, partial [Pseudomonadota bacterium]|nr:GvpL/GvpF family gas vesicle protein [Pseudomonadota bacterium]
MIAPGQNQALYLFYVTGAEFAGDAQAAEADPPLSLFAHRYAGLVSVLGIVSIDEFCGPEAERNLGELGWVGERALRHQRVIEQGFHRGPVLPARFGTLFSSLPALERFIDANRYTIGDFLGRVQGHEEWGVKA